MGWFDRYVNPGGRGQDPGNGWPGQSVPPAGPPVQPPPPTAVPAAAGPSAAGAVAGAVNGPSPWAGNMPGVLPGWDAQKWNDPNKQNEKYKVGRILAKYPPTTAGLQQAIPELKAAYPDMTFDGKDSITIPALGMKGIDVLQGASNGGKAWQWIDNNVDQGGPQMGNLGNQGVQPMPPQGGGAPPMGGGGGHTDTGGSGDWSMPKGSDYQFGGVPGYSGGYQAGAFGGPQPWQPPISGDPTGTGSISPPGRGMMTKDSPYEASAFSLAPPSRGPMDRNASPDASRTGLGGAPVWQPPMSTTDATGMGSISQPGRGAMTKDAAISPDTMGQFGTGSISPPSRGVMTADGQHTTAPPPGHDMTGAGSISPPQRSGYDRAPSFTPLDPFKAPPVPGAAPAWKPKDIGAFTLPTGQDALTQDPGYQFRMDQGTQALLQNKALRGTLATGGTGKALQDYGQQFASGEYQNAVNRALATAGFNANATTANNQSGFQAAGWNADQAQREYENKYGAANQGYAYANQQNLAGNNQALEGYKTDVGRDLGMRGLKITADQNSFMNSLNGQQQQWMQMYMMNGQSFDQAYKMMMAQLQYPA